MTIKELWEKYETNVIPAEADEIQRKETRRAFYAGGASLLDALTDAPDQGADKGAEVIEGYIDEFRAYGKSVIAGLA